MANALTPFQLWSLYRLFSSPRQDFRSTDLLLECCSSAIMTLKPDNIDNELCQLAESGLLTSTASYYQISDRGILLVRQHTQKILDACNQNMIPPDVIKKQDPQLVNALKRRSSDLADLIVSCGVKDIGPIMELLSRS